MIYGNRKDHCCWLLAQLLIFICVLTGLFVISSIRAEEQGGTDQYISIIGEAGGPGEDGWRTIHGFVLKDNESNVDDPMNITIAESVKWDDDHNAWVPHGHIFGSLENISWDQEPEPFIEITLVDFEEYKEDDNNLTITILGEYYRENGNESELRTAYREITITRPYRPPVPVLSIAVAGIWSWVNVSDGMVINIPISESTGILHVNASGSYDPDGEQITHWNCSKDGLTVLTDLVNNTNNRSIELDRDHTHSFWFQCTDEGGMLSDPLTFQFRLSLIPLQPNLSIESIEADKTTMSINERANITIVIKNDGEGDAHYVDVYFFEDNEFQYYRSLDILYAGKNDSVKFFFYGDIKRVYNLSFTIADDGRIQNESASIQILVGVRRIPPYPRFPPSVDINYPTNNSSVSSTIRLSGRVDFDQSVYGELSLEISIDGGVWKEIISSLSGNHWEYNLDVRGWKSGSHRIAFRAFDGAWCSDVETLQIIVTDEESGMVSDFLQNESLITWVTMLSGLLCLLGFAHYKDYLRIVFISFLTLPIYLMLKRDAILNEDNHRSIYYLRL